MATSTTKEKGWQRKEREAVQERQRANALAAEAVTVRVAAMPKVGDRVRVLPDRSAQGVDRFNVGKEGTVTKSFGHPPNFEIILEFDEWEHCDECGQKTRKRWTRLRDTNVKIVRRAGSHE